MFDWLKSILRGRKVPKEYASLPEEKKAEFLRAEAEEFGKKYGKVMEALANE